MPTESYRYLPMSVFNNLEFILTTKRNPFIFRTESYTAGGYSVGAISELAAISYNYHFNTIYMKAHLVRFESGIKSAISANIAQSGLYFHSNTYLSTTGTVLPPAHKVPARLDLDKQIKSLKTVFTLALPYTNM
jgi:hypothetical protein